MTCKTLTSLERAVLEKLTSGNSPLFRTLSNQLVHCAVRERELSGAGFFTRMLLPESVERLSGVPETFSFGDVQADIPGIRHGVGFLLWVKQGALDMLEGYTYDEAWPEKTEGFTLRYTSGQQRDEASVLQSIRNA